MNAIDSSFETWKKAVFKGIEPGPEQSLQAEMAFYSGVLASAGALKTAAAGTDRASLEQAFQNIEESMRSHVARMIALKAVIAADASVAAAFDGFHEKHKPGPAVNPQPFGPEFGDETVGNLVDKALEGFARGLNSIEASGQTQTNAGPFCFHVHVCVRPADAEAKPHAVH